MEFGKPVHNEEHIISNQMLHLLESVYEDNLLEALRTSPNRKAASLLTICVFSCGEWRKKHPNPIMDAKCGCHKCCIQKYLQDLERQPK